MDQTQRIAGIILAGGRGSRMGGADKALLDLAGQPLIAHVARRLGCAVAVSANGDPARFAGLGLPVLADSTADRPGPLAGVLAGLEWAGARGWPGIVTAAVDTPLFPVRLATDLARAGTRGTVVLAHGRGSVGGEARLQPTFGWWPVGAAGRIRAALDAGERRVEAVARGCGLALLEVSGPHPFLNINTPGDLLEVRSLVAAAPDGAAG